ncbi:MAG: GNAT family N-acetyltransferase [Chloroflexota bacterium]
MSPVDIRRIAPTDWALLREMRLASLTDAPEAFGQRYENAASEPEAEWRSAARASSSGDRRAWFIARRGEGAAARDVGLVQARRRPPGDCLLFSMWVAPAARRSGAGRLLVNAVAAWAAGWGGKRVVLWVFGANEGALRFYQRLGFKLLPEGPDAESGRSFGALAMELPIGPAASA